ncbi:hypothetical protein CLV60_101125 [Dyadobacter jiangsuensis]|uniref:TonB-like protein n=1 Tax=Dyadobacter jiangsuensis TaxID=1591085 RepID=A0A2P8GIF4_9BACT|nr:hypothetical protein CLV60_101125 [Dyadobacter jiangsuensis]
MFRSFVLVVFCLISNLCFSQEFALRNRAIGRDSIPAQYPEGGDAFVKTVTRKFKIPSSVNKYSYEGVFNIHFTVNTDGIPAIDSINFAKMKFRSKRISAATLAQVRNDIRSEMDHVFEQIPEWIPAAANGTRIPYRFTLPFSVYFD